MTDTTPRPAMRARGVRRANKELVLDALRIESGSPLTRAELSDRTSLTPQALGPILADLVDDRFVTESTEASSGPGRPALTYALDPRGSLSATLVQRHREVELYVADALGNLAAYTHVPGPDVESPAPEMIENAARQLTALMNAEKLDPSRLHHVCLAVDGAVDEECGIVRRASAWRDLDVDMQAIGEQLFDGASLSVTSSARVLAARSLAEIGPRPDELVLVVLISYGTWLFASHGGRIITSHHGRSGHLSHVPIAGNDRPCRCGRVGCFSTVVGHRAMVDLYEEAAGTRATGVAEVLRGLVNDDAHAKAVVVESAQWLARGISPIVQLLDPDRLIVTGVEQDPEYPIADVAADIIARELHSRNPELAIDFVQPEMNALIFT